MEIKQICVIGIGYVGLPLAIKFASCPEEYKVIGLDIKRDVVDLLNSGGSHVADIQPNEISQALETGRLHFYSVDKECYGHTDIETRELVSKSDVFIICVPTALTDSSYRKPNEKPLIDSADTVADACQIDPNHDRLVIIESTTYPGCTEKIFKNKLSAYSKHIHLVYSPERTDPGSGRDLQEVPKIVGFQHPESLEYFLKLHKPLYSDYNGNLLGKQICNVGSISSAEAVKCTENGYRLMSISFANELARMAHYAGVDIWSILTKARESSEITLNSILSSIISRKDTEWVWTALETLISRFPVFRRSQPWGEICRHAAKCFNDDRRSSNGSFDYAKIIVAVKEGFQELTLRYLGQLKRYCEHCPEDNKIDFYKVIEGIMSKPFGLELCYPGPGAGGHCIPVDPLYLNWHATDAGIEIPLVWEATMINERVTDRIVRLLMDCLRTNGKMINERRILVFGVTYKSDVPDLRESKSLRIIQALICQGAKVKYCDPVYDKMSQSLNVLKKNHHNELEVYGTEIEPILIENVPSAIEIEGIEVVMILTDHQAFRDANIYKQLTNMNNILIIDTRNAIDPDAEGCYPNLVVWGRGTPNLN